MLPTVFFSLRARISGQANSKKMYIVAFSLRNWIFGHFREMQKNVYYRFSSRKSRQPFSARITAINIKVQPINIFNVNTSCKNKVLKRIPKTDSKLKKRDAIEDCTYFSPRFCRLKPTMVLKRPRYNIERTTLEVKAVEVGKAPSKNGAKIQPKTAVTINCSRVRKSGSPPLLLKRSVKMICSAKKIPQIIVSTSPILIPLSSEPSARKPIPVIDITAAIKT
jgi:hypothetical protein